MNVLAIDPGGTTGYAVIDERDRIIKTGNLEPADLRRDIINLMALASHVVVEVFPVNAHGRLHVVLRQVVNDVESACDSLGIEPTRVTPGVWKTSSIPASPKAINGRRLSAHERDAIRMGRWMIRRYLRDQGG